MPETYKTPEGFEEDGNLKVLRELTNFSESIGPVLEQVSDEALAHTSKNFTLDKNIQEVLRKLVIIYQNQKK